MEIDQRLEFPTPEDLVRLSSQRNWVKGHFIEEADANYEDLNKKLNLLQTIINAGWIELHETVQLQCLGVTLGDCFVQALSMEWVSVTDEYGRDPAIRVPGTTIILFPLTMISKRLERGETVDVTELFEGVLASLRDIMQRTKKLN